MTLRTPLIYNPTTLRIDELPAGDQITPDMIANLMGRNAIINGNFRWWQRGISFTSLVTATYTADRWLGVLVNDTMDINQAEHPAGDATNINNSRYFLRCSVVQVAGNSSLATLQHRIEDGTRKFAGKTITISLLARASSGTKLGIEVEQTFGTGGSPSASVYTQAAAVTTLTGGWQLITRTITLPPITGKTFGTATDAYLGLILWMDAGSDWATRSSNVGRQAGDFQFSDVQLELGSVATSFEYIHEQTQLAQCQRYYEKSYSQDIYPGAAAAIGYMQSLVAASGFFLSSIPTFKVSKRTIPAITTYRYSDGTVGQMTEYSTIGTLVSGRPTSVTNINTNGFETRGDGTPAAGNIVRYHWAADSEI